MKFSDLKLLLEQGKLQQFEEEIEKQVLQTPDYDLLLRQFIKNKVKNFEKYFNLLIKKGADVNFANSGGNKQSNLMVACQSGSIQSVQLLCSHPQIDFNLQDSMKKTAPFYAIENKTKNDAEIFLDKVLKLAPHLIKMPANNQTMLVLAVKRQKPQLVKILLANNAEPNYVIVDSGNTALHEALKLCKSKVTQKTKQIVKLLLEYGADPYIKNKKDKNAFEFAQKFDLQSIIDEVQVKNHIGDEQNKKMTNSPKQHTENLSHKKQSKVEFKQPAKQPAKQPLIHSNNRKNIFKANTQNQINNLIRNAQNIYKRESNRINPLQSSKKQEKYDSNQNYNQYYSTDQESSDQQNQTQDQNDEYSSFIKTQKFTDQLTKQIQQLSKSCQQNFNTASNDTREILQKLKQLAHNQGLGLKMYGSFMTGLWLKNCDIDLVLIPQDQYIAEKDPNYVENILNRFEIVLRNELSINLKTCVKNKKIKVPMLRFQVQITNNNDSFGNKGQCRKFDITVIDRNHNGLSIAHYILQNLKVFPNLKPLFFTIKSLTVQYKLCDPKKGGIRTYAIIIMLLSFLQQNLQIRFNTYSLGQLLIRFLFFFGFQYQYAYGNLNVGNSNNQDIQGIQLLPILTIYDPLNHTNNVGKNSKAFELQAMFKAAYIGLHSNTKGKRLQFIFDMKKIILPF